MDRLITVDEVADRVGVTIRTIGRWRGEGLFPKPHICGRNSVRWPESVIADYVAGNWTPDEGGQVGEREAATE